MIDFEHRIVDNKLCHWMWYWLTRPESNFDLWGWQSLRCSLCQLSHRLSTAYSDRAVCNSMTGCIGTFNACLTSQDWNITAIGSGIRLGVTTMRNDHSGNRGCAQWHKIVRRSAVNHKSSLWVMTHFGRLMTDYLSYFDNSAIIRKSAEADKLFLKEIQW